jgi:HAD superfamily hydrolase (TIGR01484 family)
MAHLIPLEDCPLETLAGFTAVLADIDDTLTLHGRLPSEAFAALEALRAAGLLVVPVTGRPAGWCDHIARMWPVDGVVGENGAFYFRYDDEAKKMRRVYAQAAEERRANLDRLWAIAKRVLAGFPETAIAADQAYREIDVAIDFREDVPPLPLSTAEAIARAFQEEGATAKISSIHINAWFGDHDKLSMARRFLSTLLGTDIDAEKARIAYAGDSPNDAPMFAFFPNAVGVANLMPFRTLMSHLPHFVTENEGGYGFAEFAQAILDARVQAP